MSSDKVNLRTCADSCRMLIDLIRYLAEDGDLIYHEPLDIQADADTDISANVSTIHSPYYNNFSFAE